MAPDYICKDMVQTIDMHTINTLYQFILRVLCVLCTQILIECIQGWSAGFTQLFSWWPTFLGCIAQWWDHPEYHWHVSITGCNSPSILQQLDTFKNRVWKKVCMVTSAVLISLQINLSDTAQLHWLQFKCIIQWLKSLIISKSINYVCYSHKD